MATKVDFIPSTFTIKVKTGVTDINVTRDLYSAAKLDWNNEVNDLQKILFPFVVVGGDPLTGGQVAPSFFFLQSPWTIETSGDGTRQNFELNLYAVDENGGDRDPFRILPGDSVNNEISNIPGSDLLQIILNNLDVIVGLLPTDSEKRQWRDSLGINGDKLPAVGGQVQVIKDQSQIAATHAIDKLNE